MLLLTHILSNCNPLTVGLTSDPKEPDLKSLKKIMKFLNAGLSTATFWAIVLERLYSL